MSNSEFLNIDSLSLQGMEDDTEFIPLMTSEDEEEIAKEDIPQDLPILPLRNTVLFPGVVIPITAGRDKSIKLLNDAYNNKKVIGVVAQKDSSVENPGIDDVNKIGTVAKILRVLKMPDGNTTVIIQGKKKFSINEIIGDDPYLTASVNEIPEEKNFLRIKTSGKIIICALNIGAIK